VNRRELLQWVAGAIVAVVPRNTQAQPAYPDRPIKLIVPRPAGGVVDVIAREWSGKVSKTLGANFIENMGGGGGTIGAAAAARAPADGYSLLFGTTSELVISPLLGHQSYDPVAGFEPIAILCDSAASIVVHPSLPVSNLRELVAYMHRYKDRAAGKIVPQATRRLSSSARTNFTASSVFARVVSTTTASVWPTSRIRGEVQRI